MIKNRHLKIVWLYHDLMNLYGDRGNVLTLAHRAEMRGIKVETVGASIGEDIPKDADIIFFGGGQDQEQDIVSDDLKSKESALRGHMSKGGALIAVCGGYQLLGKSYEAQAGKTIPGLGILPVNTLAGEKRMIGDLLINTSEGSSKFGSQLIGFENHSGKTYIDEGGVSLGEVEVGFGNNGEDAKEGVKYKTAIGTYLHGPVLPKNPQLADWLLIIGLASHGDTESLPKLRENKDHVEWLRLARTQAADRAKNRKSSGLGLKS